MNTIGINLSNKTEIINAINDYSEFSTNQKKIFVVLVNAAVNYICKVTINYINEETNATRATISHTLSYLKENGFVKLEYKGNRFTGCEIVSSKLNDLITHYEVKRNKK
tara:strand:+ start:234 stop:560 length:327 start_codon:yes stop_codon:yes gene_type:complete